MMEWQYLFRPHIIERGYDYFLADAVDDFEVHEGMVNAIVEGTDDYAVTIEFSQEKITSLYCDCPYAADGNHCKHMAAVLFECNEQKVFQEQDSMNSPAASSDLGELVMTTDEAKLRAFLLTALTNDDKLAHRFTREFSISDPKKEVRSLIGQIDDTFDRHGDRQGFIDYNAAFDFGHALLTFLYEEVDPIIADGDYMLAFEILGHLVNRINMVEMDDSGGQITMILSECYEHWQEILEHAEVTEKKKMFEWFTEQLDSQDYEYSDDYIEESIKEGFPEVQFNEIKLNLAEKKIRQAEMLEGWQREFRLAEWAVFLIDAMERSGKSENEINEIYQRYWTISSVRKKYIEEAIAKKDYTVAIEVLQESLELDRSHRGLVSEYSHLLKTIYKTMGQKDRYVEQLWQLLLVDDQGNIEIYRELKATMNKADWSNAVQRIYSTLAGKDFMDKLYLEEERYDLLMDYVENSNELYAARRYFDQLKEEYPKRLVKKYETALRQMAAPVSNRKKYYTIANLMKDMLKIPGGTIAGRLLIQDFKTMYPRRTAMVDELSKVERLFL